jgi:hypothetical protein
LVAPDHAIRGAGTEAGKKEGRRSVEPHRPRGPRQCGATSGRKQDTGQGRLHGGNMAVKVLLNGNGGMRLARIRRLSTSHLH